MSPETAEVEVPGFIWEDPEPVESAELGACAVDGEDGAPGELGLWVFILGDMTLFGAFFTVFMWENHTDRATFANSAAELHLSVGAVNTLVLLLSSYLVVLALHAQRQGASSRVGPAIAGALCCAVAFALLKVFEYSSAFASGHEPTSNMFWTFYFVLTGIHLLHVVIGACLLTVWWRRSRRDYSWEQNRRYTEGSAVYWHMVDLLWVVIFTIVYVGCTA